MPVGTLMRSWPALLLLLLPLCSPLTFSALHELRQWPRMQGVPPACVGDRDGGGPGRCTSARCSDRWHLHGTRAGVAAARLRRRARARCWQMANRQVRCVDGWWDHEVRMQGQGRNAVPGWQNPNDCGGMNDGRHAVVRWVRRHASECMQRPISRGRPTHTASRRLRSMRACSCVAFAPLHVSQHVGPWAEVKLREEGGDVQQVRPHQHVPAHGAAPAVHSQ